MRPRALLMVAGFGCLALGVGAGLARAGVGVPPVFLALSGLHAELMIGGFFGTVIGLERAVALGTPAGYLVPALSALGAISLAFGGPLPQAQLAQVVAAAGLIAVSWSLAQRAPAFHGHVLTGAAAAWLVGDVVRLSGGSTDAALPWWIGFLVFTIAGERLELSRLMPRPPNASRIFGGIALVALAAAPWMDARPDLAWRVFGAALLLLALWLPTLDVARRTVRGLGLARYVAIALFCGYFWLAAGGLLLAAGADAGLLRDAALHAILLGFVFSMVFGHAPMILPAVTGARVPYTPLFYAPLVIFQATLLARFVADLAGEPSWRAMAGAANGVALGLFLLLVAGSILRGAR